MRQLINRIKQYIIKHYEINPNKPIGFEIKVSEDIKKLVGYCKDKIENKEDKNKSLEHFYKNIKIKDKNPSIELFWRLIDLKILLDQLSNNLKYEFSRYYFPSFDKKYKPFDILQGEADKREFDRETNFLRCQFLSDVDFKSCEFENKVSFNLAEFCKDKKAEFNRTRFEDVSYFRKTYFKGDTDFEACFFANATFDEVSFPKNDNIDKVDVRAFNGILTGITLAFVTFLFISTYLPTYIPTYYFQQLMFLVDSIAVCVIIFFVFKLLFWIILHETIDKEIDSRLHYSNSFVRKSFINYNRVFFEEEESLYEKLNASYSQNKDMYEKNQRVRYISLLLGQDVFKTYREKLPSDEKDSQKQLNDNQKKLPYIADFIKLKYLFYWVGIYSILSVIFSICCYDFIQFINNTSLFEYLYIPFQLVKWFVLIYGIYYIVNMYVKYRFIEKFLDNDKLKEKTIHMERVTMKEMIWSDFTTAHDVQRIDTNRETLARLKESNNNKGNFIDANLFFAAESNGYITKTWKKFVTFPTLGDAKEDCNNKPPKTIFGRLSLLPDIISFVFAKYTSNYGTSWVIPLIWMLLTVIGFSSTFEMNKDFTAIKTTPSFLLCSTSMGECEPNIKLEKKNEQTDKVHFDYYNHEFDSEYRYILNTNLPITVSVAYLVNSAYSTFFAKEKWFVTKADKKKFLLKIGVSILLLYLLGAFVFAIKNRTRRA